MGPKSLSGRTNIFAEKISVKRFIIQNCLNLLFFFSQFLRDPQSSLCEKIRLFTRPVTVDLISLQFSCFVGLRACREIRCWGSIYVEYTFQCQHYVKTPPLPSCIEHALHCCKRRSRKRNPSVKGNK